MLIQIRRELQGKLNRYLNRRKREAFSLQLTRSTIARASISGTIEPFERPTGENIETNKYEKNASEEIELNEEKKFEEIDEDLQEISQNEKIYPNRKSVLNKKGQRVSFATVL